EIRTPLNAIVRLSELLSKEDLPSAFRESIEAIYYSAQHLSRVVNDILDFSKIEARQVKLALATFDFRQTMQEAVNLIYSKSSEKKVPVNLTIAPDIPTTLTGDKYKLHQILLNLLFNALKFTIEGEVRLDAQLHQETATEAEVQFTITDTGIGIAEEQLKTIFDSFKQVSENTLPPTEGTGLGLAIVKKLVDLHGGRIQVTSKLQQGTCFTLYLPFSKIAAPTQKKESQSLQKQQVAKKRILLAEDNEINQLVYRQIFKKWQVHITIVNNGLEVIDYMKNQRYDVLILDLQMPLCNGVETTRIVRDPTSAVLQHDIPIMALTADALIETKEKALAEGIDAYLVKPVRHDVLLAQILHLLSPHTYMKAEEAASASIAPVLDYHFVRSIVGDDRDAFKEILEEFLKVTAADLQELSQHVTNAAYLAVRELAHKLKATFRDMDMPAAADLAEALEQ
ncbi:MAG: ATP-binding protein, partial [Bacteroidota bacterium]